MIGEYILKTLVLMYVIRQLQKRTDGQLYHGDVQFDLFLV